jgi:hypothetical protein
VSELSVAANDIGDAGAHALAAALATSMLTVIRLSSLSGRARAPAIPLLARLRAVVYLPRCAWYS